MTFEEFFKKKRIDLVALQASQGSLFVEFETHFNAMGEKSFDHTKKYWFNKLRREFPLAAEVKTEKFAVANPLAEQTITESLIEAGTTAPPTKAGFVPRFKAAGTPKPAADAEPAREVKEDGSAPPPKVGFTPKFKAGAAPKPTESAEPVKQAEGDEPAPPAKVGFTPRFKAGVTEKPVVNTEPEKGINEIVPDEIKSEEAPPKPAFKPRFNMKTMVPKPPEKPEE